MRHMLAGAVIVASLTCGGAASAADDPAPPPTYTKDVKPFLNKYCMNCHNDARPRSGVSVETLTDLLQNGKRGALVVAEKPDDSRLLKVLTGMGKPMPPRRNQQPKADEIAHVRDWIAAGAKDDTASADDDKKKTPDPSK